MTHLLLAFALALAPQAAVASAYPQGIDGTEAARLVGAAMQAAGVSGAPPPPARGLPPCDHAPHVTPLQGSWSTAELVCDAPRPWKRALRTHAPASHAPRAGAAAEPDTTPAVLLRHGLAKGSVVAPGDLDLRGNLPPGALEAVAGRRLRVALSAGQPVLPRHLEPDWLVLRGGPVALRVGGAGLEILAPGEALQDGALGDVVEVRNLGSDRVIRAVVTARNKVEARPNMR